MRLFGVVEQIRKARGGAALDALARDTLYDLRRRTSLRCYHDLIDDVIFDDASHTATGSRRRQQRVTGRTQSERHVSQGCQRLHHDQLHRRDGNYNDASEPVVDRIGHWTTEGFYQPVDMSGAQIVWNTVKVVRRCR